MRVYIAHNGLCDPARNIGTCRLFTNGQDVDAYIKFFVASIKPDAIRNWRILVTNDDVEFDAVDHFLLFNEKIGLEFTGSNKIKEINIYDLARECNEAFQKLDKRRSEAKALAIKHAKAKEPEEPQKFDVV